MFRSSLPQLSGIGRSAITMGARRGRRFCSAERQRHWRWRAVVVGERSVSPGKRTSFFKKIGADHGKLSGNTID